MTIKKPDSTRFPIAVLTWALQEIRARGVQFDVYHDLGADVVIAFDYTKEKTMRAQFSRTEATKCAADLLRRFAPDLSMPAKYVGNHPAPRRQEPPPVPPAAAPPPTQAELRRLAQTPLEIAALNGIGKRSL
jgi:hypothetical protein